MKKFAFSLLLLFGLLAFSQQAVAQYYTSAVGARLGYPTSVSIKHFLNEKLAVEAYAGTRGWVGYRFFSVSGAAQWHTPIESVDGLQWYAGAGATAYFWNYNFTNSLASSSFGVQGYLGLDWDVGTALDESIPLSITVDWVPTFFLGDNLFDGYSGLRGDYGSVGLRYIFNR